MIQGCCPEGWETRMLGQVFRERREKGSDSEFPALSVTMQGILPQLETVAKTDRGDDRKIVRVGDYVINSRSDRKGSGGISPLKGSVSLISIVMEPVGIVPEFAHHLLRSVAFQEEFYRFGRGIVADLWSTRFDDLKRIQVFLPPKERQIAIASLLDRETARIDALIEKKTRFIELLKEKRQALITQAVTKGLDPNVPMRESGVEWIGEVPGHWKVAPFFAIAKEKKVSNKGMLENNLLSLSYGNIIQKDIDTMEGLLPESFETYQIVDKGDIIFRFTDLQNDMRSLRSGLVGQRGIITSAYLNVVVEGMESKYVAHLMRAYDVMKVFYGLGGGLRQALRFDGIRQMPILIPPIAEQISICSKIDSETSRIDALVEKSSQSIGLLKERRSALITAAVTGQIDLRRPHDPSQ